MMQATDEHVNGRIQATWHDFVFNKRMQQVVVFAACGYRPPGRGPAKEPFQTLKNLAPSRASGADEDL